ncbi:MAG: hypothetical protein GX878_01290 [Firmicutes bacterium]|nr:hypothetical protein [Bacillota bacterium]
MEGKSNTLLMVAGILMIIGGIFGTIVGIIAVVSVGALAGTLGSEVNLALLIFSAIITPIGAVVCFVAGIVGVKNAAKPEKANLCIIFGILTAAFLLLSNVLTAVGGSFNTMYLVIGLLVPALYLVGAFQNKNIARRA